MMSAAARMPPMVCLRRLSLLHTILLKTSLRSRTEYVAVASCYFDPSPAIWLSAVGISGLIGIALIFATGTPGKRTDGWTKFRLFLFPFCVSSYSTLIKGRGFILLFPTQANPLIAGITACAGVVAIHWICRGLSVDARDLRLRD